MNSLIYDFETLSKDPQRGVVLSLAAILFDEDRYLPNPYTFRELIGSATFIKFSVEDQVNNYGRQVDLDTVEWWMELPIALRAKWFSVKSDDEPLRNIIPFLQEFARGKLNRVYTRGNTFDPIFIESILKDLKVAPILPWWALRDTRSMIEGLAYGSNLKNDFMPEGLNEEFVKHDPIHDIAIDIIRMQTLVRALS